MAYGIDKAMAAIHIGAATPLIVNALSSQAPPSIGEDNLNDLELPDKRKERQLTTQESDQN